MAKQTYYSYLDGLRGNPELLTREKYRLDALIEKLARQIKAGITSETAGGLIWALGLKELRRVEPLVGISLSDFAGHARHLRALAAAVPKIGSAHSKDPEVERLFKDCEDLWLAIAMRGLIDDLTKTREGRIDQIRGMHSGMMNILGAFQGEVEYVEQAEHRIRVLFGPFSHTIIEPAIGLSVEQIGQGFSSLRSKLPHRLNKSRDLMKPAFKKWEEWKVAEAKGASGEVLDSLVRDDPGFERTGENFREAMTLLTSVMEFSPDDFADVLGGAATAFLEAFSFVPGTVNQEYLTPFCKDEVRACPFAKIEDGRYLLFDPCYAYWAPLYRLQSLFTTPEQQQRLTRQRDRSLEKDVAALLTTVVQPTLSIENYYVQVADDGKLAERDLLLFRDGTLIIVESKAQSFRPIFEHPGDLNRIVHLVRSSIQKGYDQARSVYHALRRSTGDLALYDSDKAMRTETAKLSHKSVREVFTIVCLDDWYGLIATDLKPWIEIDISVGYPWVVDRNTLEAILLKIDTLDKLTGFLRWRQSVQGVAMNEDEAVFAGFYATHGPAKFPKDADIVQLDANYADMFEAAHFKSQGIDVPQPERRGKPAFGSIRRQGEDLVLEINGRVDDVLDFRTGEPSFSEYAQTHLSKRVIEPRRIGRNEPCPCGSGLKYKKCCGRQE